MTDSETSSEYPSIAVVVLDTLRKDAFDEHFDWLPGRRFESTWSPSHWTVPVHGSLFTGKYASETGVHAKSRTFDYPGDALAELLSDQGYSTKAFTSNVNVSAQQGFDRGFDEFQGNWRVSSMGSDVFDWGGFAEETEHTGLSKYLAGVIECIQSDARTVTSLSRGAKIKLRDIDVNGALVDDGAKEAKTWLEESEFGSQDFLFMNLMEAHSPYLPPRGYRTVKRVDIDGLRAYLDQPSIDPEIARQAYDDSVKYLSNIYCDIYDSLSENFDYIITLSDHGEALGEHGAWDHLYGLYPEITHVPLVVDGPGLKGKSEQTMSLLDVHATVLDLAGIDGESRGRSLLTNPDSAFWLTEFHGITPMQIESLADSGYDPSEIEGELNGIAGPNNYYGYETNKDIVERGDLPANSFQEKLAQMEEDLSHRAIEQQSESEELRPQLEALGYL